MSKEIIIKELLVLAKKAIRKEEVPVSAIVVHNNKVIAKQYNKREHKKDVTAHAEVLAIRQASRKLKRWNLSDCNLYVTLQPCSMCTAIIQQSRIKNVYYLTEKLDYKHEYSKTAFRKLDFRNQEETYQQLLSSFFQNKR